VVQLKRKKKNIKQGITKELVLIMEKILLRIPEQISSSFCCRRWRWMWWRTTGSKMRRDSERRKIRSQVCQKKIKFQPSQSAACWYPN